MRPPSRVVRTVAVTLAMLGCVACVGAGPLAAVPLANQALQPQALAAPTEDGSVYVLAEGGPMTSTVQLKTLWRREATKACDGDYMVLSEREAQSRRAGVIGTTLYEGFVRCVSPEGMKLE